jgi:hypothetical protein
VEVVARSREYTPVSAHAAVFKNAGSPGRRAYPGKCFTFFQILYRKTITATYQTIWMSIGINKKANPKEPTPGKRISFMTGVYRLC